VAALKLKRDEAARFPHMLGSRATSDGSIDPPDRIAEIAPGILRDDQDPRRRSLSNCWCERPCLRALLVSLGLARVRTANTGWGSAGSGRLDERLKQQWAGFCYFEVAGFAFD
jgi:hypothetical protein